MTASVAAIVLAAGAGRRMGGRPKALLPIDDETFLARVVRTCRDAGCDEVCVVVPAEPPSLLTLAQSLKTWAVVNSAPERGMFSSVQIGMHAAGGAGAFLLFAVDHPRVQASTVRALLDALAEVGPAAWLRPAFEGHGGHPILVPGSAAAALLLRDPTEPLRDALRSAGLSPQDVPVDDPGVLANLNRPEHLAE